MKLPDFELGRVMMHVIRGAMLLLVASALYSLYITYAYRSGDGSVYAEYLTVPEQIESITAGIAVVCGGGAAAQYILYYLGK